MNYIDIIVIVIVSLIVVALLTYFISKKIKGGNPLSECDCCKGKSDIVKKYNKKYKKN